MSDTKVLPRFWPRLAAMLEPQDCSSPRDSEIVQ